MLPAMRRALGGELVDVADGVAGLERADFYVRGDRRDRTSD